MVWTDPGGAIAPKLVEVLSARGLPPVHANSTHAALAELCLAERAGVRAALILSTPADASRLLAAVERFAPSAVVWTFQSGANPPLRPFVLRPKAAGPAPARTAPVAPPEPPAEAQPIVADVKPMPRPATNGHAANGHPVGPVPVEPIRLVRENGLSPDTPAPEPARKNRPVSSRDVLNDAELEMLLAGERATEDDRR